MDKLSIYHDPYYYCIEYVCQSISDLDELILIKFNCRMDTYTQINHVPGTRFELVTRGFSVLCSTS